ncbi:glycosyltransferase family 2 protein [Cronbergia sp. UHCC 0137]|uniref:glycosyltransferase family 2 protein n=1 Tax=Cronbergia sp. UHCC 0137 TaxID=3110239 RepID=UPI002B1ED271|nr:glycosyltransferase family 2 protein [Cronbergia sp. UHCC 0137]MEA5617439.1 glycosyltransferase family 2 protein [Cronbergia sp. UHCC 0137]
MLVFVVPLKSPGISKSWERVSKLFERSVKSICNQTSNNFRAIVVCSEKPKIEFNHPNIIYIEKDFGVPIPDWKNKNLDRTRKLITGLDYAKQIKPSHIMCVDADDCVSKYLAEFVDRHYQANGWLIKKGYIYAEGSKLIRIMRKGFDRYCGTSNIIRYDLYDVPEIIDDITMDEYTECLFNHYRHREIGDTLAKKGHILEPLPFAGAIYNTRHQDNQFYGVEDQNRPINLKIRLLKFKALFDARWVNKSIRDEFKLYNINDDVNYLLSI